MAHSTYLKTRTMTSLTKYAHEIETTISNIKTDQLRNYTRSNSERIEQLERLAEVVQEQIENYVWEKTKNSQDSVDISR